MRSVREFSIQKQHAGDQLGIDAMIAAPEPVIVVKQRSVDFAHGIFPRRAVPLFVTDHEVRPVGNVRPVILLVAIVHGSNRAPVSFGIVQSSQLVRKSPGEVVPTRQPEQFPAIRVPLD